MSPPADPGLDLGWSVVLAAPDRPSYRIPVYPWGLITLPELFHSRFQLSLVDSGSLLSIEPVFPHLSGHQ
jgi:hypothetical protein